MHEISVSGEFEIKRNGFLEKGHNVPRKINKSIPYIQKFIKKLPYYSNRDIIIYSTDYLAAFNTLPNAIAIQHGIAWDVPYSKETIKNKIKPHFLFESKIKIVRKISRLVCVDYNYPNWFRATYPLSSLLNKMVVITNFAEIKPFSRKEAGTGNKLKICFARRFEDYRGSIIFSDAIKLLKDELFFNDLEFTFAGGGSKEQELRNTFINYNNVSFIKYNANESLDFHLTQDIAVIPTIGSEGTSLSAIEAMSAGCAVVCTGVGGLSNIVINNHNGLLIDPNAISIANAIKELYENRDKLFSLQKKGHDTAKDSFDQVDWFDKWKKIIMDIENELIK